MRTRTRGRLPHTATSSESDAESIAHTHAAPAPEKHFIRNVLRDQAAIWTSPFRLHASDAKWLAPLGVGAAALFATDRYTSAWVDRNGGLPVFSRDVSWFGKPYVTGGVAGAFYLAGLATHDRQARETGDPCGRGVIDTGFSYSGA